MHSMRTYVSAIDITENHECSRCDWDGDILGLYDALRLSLCFDILLSSLSWERLIDRAKTGFVSHKTFFRHYLCTLDI